MHPSSTRRRLLGAILGLLAVAGLAFVLTGSPEHIPTVGPSDLGTGSAAPGATVYLEGEFDSMPSDRVIVMRGAGPDDPQVRIDLAAGPGFRIGTAGRVLVHGTVVSATRVKDATLVLPGPPSKYIEAVSKNAH